MQRCPDRRYMELKVKKVRYAIVYLTNKGIYIYLVSKCVSYFLELGYKVAGPY